MVTQDDSGRIRSVSYLDLGPSHENVMTRGRGLPKSFLRGIADKLGVDPGTLSNLDQSASYNSPEKRNAEYRLIDEKTYFDTTTYIYRQTYLNTPVWSAGLTVTVQNDRGHVLSMTNTSEGGINAKLPPHKDLERYRKLFATGEKTDPGGAKAADGSDALLSNILDKAARNSDKQEPPPEPKLIRGRFFVYCYDTAKRLRDWPESSPEQGLAGAEDPEQLPILPLPAVPKSIKDGVWRFVAELIIRLPYQGRRMNWRLLVDVETDAVLYLRALVSGVNGLVFTYDPITSTGNNANDATQSNATLNPLRDDVELEGLDPPAGGTQSLTGSLITIAEVEAPTVAAPTRPAGVDFDFDARTNDFAAVNAYYHNDRFFRLVENLGFPLDDYFDGTSFPVEIDHRGIGGANNAHCIGDGDGIDHACYGLIDSQSGDAMGNAVELSVVLHELGGHGILYDHVNSANLGFSHSAGDSFAIILNDFASEWHNGGAIDRFIRSPFRQNLRVMTA